MLKKAEENFDDTKGVTRCRNSNKRTDNTMAERKRTNNDLQNTTETSKDRETRND